MVNQYGSKGLAYIKIDNKSLGVNGLTSPIIKFFNDSVCNELIERVGAKDGDLVFFVLVERILLELLWLH